MDQDRADDREEARLGALRDLNLLDTPESEGFDRITRMASRLFGAPISAVSLTDRHRQWFKSHLGTAGREIPRERAPCAEVARSASALVVPDMLRDARFADSLLARSGIRFYAGAPLVTRDGHALGAMCVLDKVPRAASDDQVAALQDFAAMVMAQVELEHDFGRVDPLSGLPNRNQLEDDLLDLARAHPGAARVNVLIDLADARQIAEISRALGPSCVDDLVKASGRRVKDALGRAAGLYHTGAAAYLLVLDEAESGPWRDTMERLAAGLRRPVPCNGVPIALEPVFGVSPFRLGEAEPRDALRSVVSAAGDARAAGLGHAVYSPASDEANRRRFHLLADMREALARPGQLRLAYQPRVDARTGACLGAEALLRWRHPRFGDVSPGEFMPLVEQTALVRPATTWVLDAALDQLAAWRRAGGGPPRASVNVSANNLREPDFARRLSEALGRRALPPAAVELELTESALIGGDGGRVLEQLGLLKAMGVEIAIDDFGTGYSTFSYLRTVPADTVKLDRSFVQPLASDGKARRLVSSMVEMAHGLGFRVVAEGVETEAELAFLVGCGCEEAQGYLFCRPVGPGALEGWLAARAAAGPGGPAPGNPGAGA